MKPLSIFMLSLLTTLFSCKKDKLKQDIDLTGESLQTVQKYINGRWELLSGGGGFTGSAQVEFTANFMTFSADHFKWTASDTVRADSAIVWMQIRSADGKQVWLMASADKDGTPLGLEVRYIKDGFLHLFTNGADPFGYTLQRAH